MDNNVRYNISPLKGLIFSIVLLAVGAALAMAVGSVIVMLITGNLDLQQIASPSIYAPNGLAILRTLQMSQTIGMFIFPPIVIALLASKKPWQYLGFHSIPKGFIPLSVLLILLLVPGINLLASLNAMIPVSEWMLKLEKATEELMKALLLTNSFKTFSINLVMVAILPAIGEELFFRSILQKYFIRLSRNNAAGIIITSLIFSAIHMQFLGFFPRFILGVILGYLYLWSGTILIPILVHFVNNGMAVLVFYLMGSSIINTNIESIGEVSHDWFLGVLSLVLSGILLWEINRRYLKARNTEQ